MEPVVDFLRHGTADAVNGFQILDAGTGNRLGRPEVMQERLLAFGPDSRHLIKDRLVDLLAALRTVGTNGEAVRLITDSLQEVQHRVLVAELDRF